MSARKVCSHWIVSNNEDGHYDGSDWDMSTIRTSGHYYLKEAERNRKHLKAGDIVVMRLYGLGFVGTFEAGEWVSDEAGPARYDVPTGYVVMENVCWWQRTLPQGLVWMDLSCADMRSRVVRIKERDADMLETARRIHQRLGFGGADGEIVVLEAGIEEAIKPNLARLGLRLAQERIPGLLTYAAIPLDSA